jgi:hypothetical protein
MKAPLLVGIAMAGFLGSCGATPEPSIPAVGNVFAVDVSSQRLDATVTAFVIDDAGLVVGARRAEVPGGTEDADVIAFPESNGLRVIWFGGVCNLGPTVTLSGSAEALLVTVRPDAGDSAGACVLIGLSYKVDIALSQPVRQDAVSVIVR